MRFSLFQTKNTTFEGAPAPVLSPEAQLERSVLACLLWEDAFYEDGASIAERIRALVPLCSVERVLNMALRARTEGRLRHVPLLLMREAARHPEKPKLAGTLAQIIQRADEPAEFLELYWSEGKEPLSSQVKQGLAEALCKFDAYQLAKYNRQGRVKLRDVLFMTHAKPRDAEQAAVWKQLINGNLPAPDTWEVALSSGADKKATFTRLLEEKRLGYMALLRNLRNMAESGVQKQRISEALLQGAARSKALPFRFLAAARAVPQLEDVLDQAMLAAMAELPVLRGKTAMLVDVSGSMEAPLSRKSDLSRLDAAAALAVLVAGIAPAAQIFTFSNNVVPLPSRKGMALADAIWHSQPHGCTYLGQAVQWVQSRGKYDRLIVITDEQSADSVPNPRKRGYMINVASYQNGVNYGAWVGINGFSESVIRYIQALEESEGFQR